MSAEATTPGELLVLWSPSSMAFVQTGIILAVEPSEPRSNGMRYYECHTIEGNVTPTARLDGDRMGRVARFVSPEFGDRTIRWTELEPPDVSVRQRPTSALRAYDEERQREALANAALRDAGRAA
jgi:hypothetical protein